MLPTSPTTITNQVPSYLYFQYLDDPDLPSLIAAYNTITQNYLNWFSTVNLPVYTGLSGALLDWIGQGVYGLPRPNLATTQINGMIGQLASQPWRAADSVPAPTPTIVEALATTQLYEVNTGYVTTDDIYKRILTWWFYKADGTTFSIPWLKRRITRFLFGINGMDVNMPFTPNVSVVFSDSTLPLPTCEITLSKVGTNISTVNANFFQACVETGALNLPFRFAYTVTLTT